MLELPHGRTLAQRGRPVSYTHLQVVARVARVERKLEDLHAGKTGIGEQLHDLGPVSYTHLDVYKRQVIDKLKTYGIETLEVVCSGDGVENVRDAVLRCV